MPETAPLGGTMSDLNGNGAESNQDAEDHEAQLLCLKIKDHLEEMFSDSHLAEDGFLLKHMQKNKQGYVSLKLLTCLKKIKALTTNWYMTLAAAECSDLLELNEECTKVRRKEALPQWLMCSPTSRLLLIWNASEEQSAEDGADPGQPSLLLSILQRFDSPGDVASVWILHPGEELPKELQCYAKRHKELGQLLCAVMKFNSLESVRRAYSSLREEEKINGRGLCVVPLGWQSVQSMNKFDPSENKGDATCSMGDPQNVSQVSLQQDPPSPLRFSEETGEAYPPPAGQEDSSCSQKSLRGLTKRYSWTDWCSGDRNTPFSQCPWVLKRKSAASAAKLETAEHLNTTGLILKVLRQPFGPDDTKGFNGRRQKYDFLE
ncbi:PREDICTED: la-related protein 6-like [Poecilia mexicana]|nr:PREDICTED: la-related protein 6-like [Poecilia formosa]XP_014837274.1 PREDICTED: la-related protein 6-like [Poecilia mexicana]